MTSTRQPAQWNGDPECKPHDWVDLPQSIIRPWNGPIEFKPHDWEQRQIEEHHARRGL